MDNITTDAKIILRNVLEFKNKQHYCDLHVKIDDKQYHCHRLILAASSGYFDSLFNSTFPDSKSPEITLEDISTEVFDLILTYMYTGQVQITLKNAYDVLKTSNYLVMKELEKFCRNFIEKNFKVDNILNICYFALSPMGDQKFAKVVVRNAAKNFRQVVNTDEFLNIDFKLLESILEQNPDLNKEFCPQCGWEMKNSQGNSWICERRRINVCQYCGNQPKNNYSSIQCCSMTIPQRENNLLSRLADWVMHDVVERLQYFPILAKYAKLEIDSKHITQWEALISKFNSQLCTSKEVGVCAKPTIHLYTLADDNRLTVLLWDDVKHCWNFHMQPEVSTDKLKGLVIGKNKFFLSNKSTSDGKPTITQFWIDENHASWRELQPPPVSGENYAIAGIGNSIYLYMYDENLVQKYKTLSYVDFQTETGSNNIYTYAVDLNKWFSIPPIPQFLFNSYFISADNKLFVIGGSTTYSLNNGQNNRQILQCFDFRTLEWTQKPINVNLCLQGMACSQGNKIYICEFSPRHSANRIIYIYHVINDAWETMIIKGSVGDMEAFISYNNRLWIFPHHHLAEVGLYVHDMNTKMGYEIVNAPKLKKINDRNCIITKILDAIVI